MNLTFLSPLYARPGPFACTYVETATVAHADRPTERWTRLRERLLAEGADEATIGALARGVPSDGGSDGGLALFAAHGRLALAETLAGPPDHDSATVTMVPDAMPLAVAHAPDIAYTAVSVSRAHDPDGGSHLESRTQTGRWPQARNNPGEERFRRAPAGEWRQEAEVLAAELTEVADREGVEAIVVAGDRWACDVLEHALPQRHRQTVVRVASDPGTGEAAGPLLLEDDVAYLFAGRLNAADRRHVEDFLAERARGGRAVEGLGATAEALGTGEVGVLIVDSPSALGREQLWVGSATHSLGVAKDGVPGARAAASWQVPADAALLRALVGSGGELVVVPEAELPLRDGVGALLREPGGPTRSHEQERGT